MRLFDEIREYFYNKKIDKYFKKVGLYDSILILQGSDREYCLSSMKAQLAGFYAKKQPNDVALLLLESAKKYSNNRKIAIDYLESAYRQFAFEAIDMGVPNIIPPQDLGSQEEEEPESFHNILDVAVSFCARFLKKILSVNANDDNYSYELCSEIIVYIVSFFHVYKNDISIPNIYWNTFKAGIENRMLAIKDDGSARSGLISTESGQAFASFVSGYFMKMDTLEERVKAVDKKNYKILSETIINFLESDFNVKIESTDQFEMLIKEIEKLASKEIVPTVIRVFEIENL
jgi:hypothetical protein